MLPIEAPIRTREGSTAAILLSFKDDDGAPVSFTGWTAHASVKRSARAEDALITFTCSIDGGTIRLEPPAPNSAPVGQHVWDLVLVNGSQLLPVAFGPWEIFHGVTDVD